MDSFDNSLAVHVMFLTLVHEFVNFHTVLTIESFDANLAHMGFLPTVCKLMALQGACL